MRRLLRAVAVVPLLAHGAQARERAPSAPPPATFSAEADYVEVDVLVTDARGDVVRGLTRDDMQLFEEGARQEIATFSEVAPPVQPADPSAAVEAALPRDVATNEDDPDSRVYAIVLDDAQTDARRTTAVRKAAGEFISRYLGPRDLAAVVFTSPAGAVPAFTRDRALLLQSVSRFAGRKVRSATLERMNAIEQQRDLLAATRPDPLEVELVPRAGVDTDPWDRARALEARASMVTLEAVARALRGLTGRRKAILFFSEGVDYDTLDVKGKVQRAATSVQADLQKAIATATWNNVALHPIDPRGLVDALGEGDIAAAAPPSDRTLGIDAQSLDNERRRSQESLRTLADETGGFAAVDTNDVATAFARIVRAGSHYYLLGYHPADFQRDGAFRRIEVRVARAGVSVVARRGYVRPRRDDEGERLEARAAPGTSAELRELLESAWPRPGLALGVTAAVFKVAARMATVAVTIEVGGATLPFRREQDRAVNEVEVSLLALDDAGRVQGGDRILAAPRLTAQTHERVQRAGLRFVRRLELPPGRYQLRVAAREAEEGRRGSVFYDLQVPDFGGDDLAMSGVLLTSHAAALALTPTLDDVVKGVFETPPTAARTFASNDVLTAYTEVYDALAPVHDLAVATRVSSVDGREVFRSSAERPSAEVQGAGGGLRHEVSVPLAGLPPGAYVLRIEARPTVGDLAAARELSFHVLPGPSASADLPLPRRDVAASSAAPRPGARIPRLEAWLGAVERHQPGASDDAVRMVESWTAADLVELATDLAVTVALIDDPGHAVMWMVDPERRGRPERAPYSSEEERRLRALAADAALRCARDPLLRPDTDARRQARRCSNRLLKRGAILHTDAAVQFGDRTTVPDASDEPERWGVRFTDGRSLGRVDNAGHWTLARALLDNVAPDPRKDETVRLWYVATSAYGQRHERHVRQEERAVELFPHDAEVLFLAGSLHETFASPRMQRLARSLRLPAGVTHGIGSEEAELRQAEQRLRRAVESRPAFTEARIRLGRVLHLRGRPEPAVRELERALAGLSAGRARGADDGLLAYYAEMFLGAAQEARGRLDRARSAYTRAAALYPDAPSPRLALSRLALSANDRTAALEALGQALRPPAEGEARDDPLWRYHVVQGREADAWLEKLRASLALEP
jgi:VWFA-related protein